MSSGLTKREIEDNIVPPGKVYSKHQIRMIEAIAGRMEEDEPVGRRLAERALGGMAIGILIDMAEDSRHQRAIAGQVELLRRRVMAE